MLEIFAKTKEECVWQLEMNYKLGEVQVFQVFFGLLTAELLTPKTVTKFTQLILSMVLLHGFVAFLINNLLNLKVLFF